MLAIIEWRLLALGTILLVTVAGSAQNSMPATAPTGVSPSDLPSANPPVSVRTASHAVVNWTGSELEVHASNASLNQLVREIAVKANLSVTGNVPEEPIFGSYGPASLDEVLSALLDGLPVNVLLVDHSGAQRKELVLTARNGAASPPDPRQQQAVVPSPAVQPTNAGVFQPVSQVPASPGALQGGIGAPTTPVQPSPADTPATGATATDPPTSPNGVKTPQQIFEQLQRLRQQGQGATPQQGSAQ